MVEGEVRSDFYHVEGYLVVYFFLMFRDYCGDDFDLVFCSVNGVPEGCAPVGENFLFDCLNFCRDSV